MTRCEYKLRDQGMWLGFFWCLLNPCLTFLFLYFIFARNFHQSLPRFWEYLLIGVVQWNFFSTATNNALTVLSRKRQIVMNFPIARSCLVLSSVTTIAISFGLELILMLGILAAAGSIEISGLPLLAAATACNLALALGTAFILSGLHVFFRDVEHLWALVLRIGFVATPVFYPIAIVDPRWQRLIALNPLYLVLTTSREALLGGPGRAETALPLLVLSALGVAGGGYFFFKSVDPLVAEYL